MELIAALPRILEESEKEYRKRCAGSHRKGGFAPTEVTGEQTAAKDNLFAAGDNCDFMEYLLTSEGLGGKLQLIYVDPPFYSKANYEAVLQLTSTETKMPPIKPVAYEDRWHDGMEAYLKMLCLRLFFMKALLSETGCLWIHLDWHVVHYVKVLADAVFGEENFVNEIIWQYKSGGTGKRRFSRKHDTLLFYSKSEKYYFQPQREKSYNRDLRPYKFKGVKEYEDKIGWYTMVNMKDVWQIDMVGRTAKERNGYATQKPEALLGRIVESCTKEGDLCADFFGGSATLAAVAEQRGRRWISCDASGIAIANGAKRLLEMGSAFTFYRSLPLLNASAQNAEMQVQVKSVPGARAGEPIITVMLQGYQVPQDGMPPDQSTRREILRLQKLDPLQLLQYWSVDFHYDGYIHRQEVLCLNRTKTPDQCKGKGTDRGQISIRFLDIFGNAGQIVLPCPKEHEIAPSPQV